MLTSVAEVIDSGENSRRDLSLFEVTLVTRPDQICDDDKDETDFGDEIDEKVNVNGIIGKL